MNFEISISPIAQPCAYVLVKAIINLLNLKMEDRKDTDEVPEPAAPRLDVSRFGPLNTEAPFNEFRAGMAWALRECAQDEDYESYPSELKEFAATVAKTPGIFTKLD